MPDHILTKYTPPPTPRGMIDITIGCFFDGTQNNRVNSRAGGIVDITNRTKEEEKASKKYKSDTNSYSNDLSNVARLEKWYNGEANKYHAKFYIEGIATADLKDDEDAKLDHKAAAYGAGGKVGIPEKVKKGVEQLITSISTFESQGQINRIIIDTFGFSRGAAAARNFVSKIIQESFNKALSKKGISFKHIDIRMVGLFDTVSSYDPHASQTTFNPNFKNDVIELDLNAIRIAKRIFHLTAADEFRENFSLTPVKIAGGVEFSLPGAHADIGGSYADKSAEVEMQILDFDNTLGDGLSEKDYIHIIDEFQQHLVDMGWYTNEQLKRNFWLELIANRTNISNKYSYIPLHMMAERLIEVSNNSSILFSKLESDYNINYTSKRSGLNLCDVKNRLDKYIKGKTTPLTYYSPKEIEILKQRKTTKQLQLILEDQKMLKQLKAEFLHFSACYGIKNIGRGPRIMLNKARRIVRFKREIIKNA